MSTQEQEAFVVHVLYTFDVCKAWSENHNPFRSGNAELTMLKNSILSTVKAALECSEMNVTFMVHVYTNTADLLSVALQHISEYADGIVHINVVEMSTVHLPEFGVNEQQSSPWQVQFSSKSAGHSRVYLIPAIIRAFICTNTQNSSNNQAVLYLDNDTYLRAEECAAAVKVLRKHHNTCLAYEKEEGRCGSLLASGSAAVRKCIPDIDTVRVSNNGVLWFPVSDAGLRVSERVQRVYESLPADAPMRYLHDMIAVSVVWGENNSDINDAISLQHLVDNDQFGAFVEHYWRQKSKPEHMASLMITLLHWRLEQDVIALMRGKDEVKVLEHASTDLDNLTSAARRSGLIGDCADDICDQQACVLPGRVNMVSMRRTKSYHSHILGEFMRSDRASARLSSKNHIQSYITSSQGVRSMLNGLISMARGSRGYV